MHFYWQIYYYPSGSSPQYSSALTSSFEDSFDDQLSRRDMLRAISLLNQETSNAPRWRGEEETYIMIFAFILVWATSIKFSLIGILLLQTMYRYSRHGRICRSALVAAGLLTIAYTLSIAFFYHVNLEEFREPMRYDPLSTLTGGPAAALLGSVFWVCFVEFALKPNHWLNHNGLPASLV